MSPGPKSVPLNPGAKARRFMRHLPRAEARCYSEELQLRREGVGRCDWRWGSYGRRATKPAGLRSKLRERPAMHRILVVLLALGSIAATSLQAQDPQAQGGAAAPIVRQKPATPSSSSKTPAAKARVGTQKAAASKAAARVPLTERERALQ